MIPWKKMVRYLGWWLLIVAIFVLAGLQLSRWRHIRSREVMHQMVYSAVEQIRQESKLVVMSTELAVSCTLSSDRVAEIWGIPLHMGTTTVRLTASGNKVQYVIPVESIHADLFSWDEVRRVVRLKVPEPVLDETLVEIQSNPDKMSVSVETTGVRLKAFSGKQLEEDLRRQLRDLVLQEARRQPLLQERAKAHAGEVLRTWLERLLNEKNMAVPVLIN